MKRKFFCVFSAIFIINFSSDIKAQEVLDTVGIYADSRDTLILESNEIIDIETERDTLENRPNTAALYSAALPGLGQAYNKKYWKIPLIYGGGMVIGYFINFNHRLYKQYRDGLIAIKDQDDRTQPFDPSLSLEFYQNRTDYWRRNRDLVMIGALLFYVMNIIDAHVDAHLELFTIDDDISLNLEPNISQTAMNTNLIGLSLKLKFN